LVETFQIALGLIRMFGLWLPKIEGWKRRPSSVGVFNFQEGVDKIEHLQRLQDYWDLAFNPSENGK